MCLHLHGCLGLTNSLPFTAVQLVMVRGTKRLVLLPPSATGQMRPRAAHQPSANHSTLDPASLHAVLATLGREVRRVELRAGEALLLPAGWWHEVESTEEVTVALNYWWQVRAARAPSVL